MKRILAIGCLVALAASAHAGPMGAVIPQPRTFQIGVEGYSDEFDLTPDIPSGGKNEARAYSYLGRLSYGLNDRIELLLRIGGAKLDLLNRTNTFTAFGSSTSDQTWSGDHTFAWGAGISGVLYRAERFTIGGQFNWLTHSDHGNGTSLAFPGGGSTTSVGFTEWNAGAQIQTQINRIYPYFGVRYSGVTIEEFENDLGLGVYGGASFDITRRWRGYLEGQLVDRTAFGGGIMYAFGPGLREIPDEEPVFIPSERTQTPAETSGRFHLRRLNYLLGPDEYAWHAGALKEVFTKDWTNLLAPPEVADYAIDGDYSIVGDLVNVSMRVKRGDVTVKRLEYELPFDPADLFEPWSKLSDAIERELLAL